MLALKRPCLADATEIWKVISRLPAEENGFLNPWAGVDPDTFIRRTLPEMMLQSVGQSLPEGWVPETHYILFEDGAALGVFRLRHRLTPELRDGAGHVGYSILPEYRNRGYGTLGLKLLLHVAPDIVPEDELYLRCREDNPASLRVMQHCGGVIHHRRDGQIFVRIPLTDDRLPLDAPEPDRR